MFIIDQKLPEMSGVELVAQLKTIINPSAVIIMISGYDISEFRESANKTGVELFLRKPIFQSELFNVLINKLNLKGSFKEKRKL